MVHTYYTHFAYFNNCISLSPPVHYNFTIRPFDSTFQHTLSGVTHVTYLGRTNCHVSRGGLAVSVSSHETTDPGSILGVAIFPG